MKTTQKFTNGVLNQMSLFLNEAPRARLVWRYHQTKMSDWPPKDKELLADDIGIRCASTTSPRASDRGRPNLAGDWVARCRRFQTLGNRARHLDGTLKRRELIKKQTPRNSGHEGGRERERCSQQVPTEQSPASTSWTALPCCSIRIARPCSRSNQRRVEQPKSNFPAARPCAFLVLPRCGRTDP